MKNMRSDSGFTLLEVVVSLAIIAAVLVTLLGTHLMNLNLAYKNREQSLTAMLARQKLEELHTIPFDSLNNDSGDFGPQHPEYSWELSVEEANIDNVKKAKLTVSILEHSLDLEISIAKTAIE